MRIGMKMITCVVMLLVLGLAGAISASGAVLGNNSIVGAAKDVNDSNY